MDCLFCKIAQKQIPSEIVFENERVVAFMDIHPINPGHVLLVPKAHSNDMREMVREDLVALYEAAQQLTPTILKAVGAMDVNISTNIGPAAGQVIFHTHVHIIPRFAHDGYKHWHREGGEAIDVKAVADGIRGQIADALK